MVETTSRIFLGIKIPDQTIKLLESRLDVMRGVGKRVPVDRQHVTFCLVGQVPGIEKYLEELSKPLEQSFTSIVTLTHLGRGMNEDQIWAYVKKTRGLIDIKEELDKRVDKLQIGDSKLMNRDGDFIPHINLAGVDEKKMPMISIDIPVNTTWRVNEVHIFASKLWREGVSYSSLGTILLNL